jgi:hypothetical protein
MSYKKWNRNNGGRQGRKFKKNKNFNRPLKLDKLYALNKDSTLFVKKIFLSDSIPALLLRYVETKGNVSRSGLKDL